MGTLTKANPNARELVTEILDETLWWSILKLVLEFLRAKNVENVRIEFGFVLDRDIAGKRQPPDQIVQLCDLERFIKAGFEEGTIEWAGSSDFLFYPLGTDLTLMLCNDAHLHFASSNSALIAELGRTLSSSGIKVYDSGNRIES